jgi:hypothetical protein
MNERPSPLQELLTDTPIDEPIVQFGQVGGTSVPAAHPTSSS